MVAEEALETVFMSLQCLLTGIIRVGDCLPALSLPVASVAVGYARKDCYTLLCVQVRPHSPPPGLAPDVETVGVRADRLGIRSAQSVGDSSP